MPKDIAKQILEYFENGQINLNGDNFQDLLAGWSLIG
jgi:hypothetical protein